MKIVTAFFKLTLLASTAAYAGSYKPYSDTAYFALAKMLKEKHKEHAAILSYKHVAKINPRHFEAAFYLANLLHYQGKIEESIEWYKRALSINGSCCQAHFNLGITLVNQGDLEQGCDCFENAIAINPHYAKAYLHYGTTLQKLKKFPEAIEQLAHALKIDPRFFDAYAALARAYHQEKDFAKAIEFFEKAINIHPHNTHVLLELANLYNMIDESEKSLELYYRILSITPKMPEVEYNIAYTLKKLGRIDEAITYYHTVLNNRPDYGEAHFGLGCAYLTKGNFAKGWEEYEWRWKRAGYPERTLSKPVWDGSNLSGKTILLHAEQGLGDTLQFIRYAQVIKEQYGAQTVIAAVQDPLITLLSRCPYLDKVVPLFSQLPRHDVQVPLMSVPMIVKTTLETLPNGIPYLQADSKLIALWKDYFDDTNFNIGICWQGNAQYSTEFLRQAVAAKSIHLSHFAPIAQIPSVRLYGLQKINGVDQLSDIEDLFHLHTFDDDFDNSHGRFMDTAAVMKNLDLVITIDTSICHLAGGLGVPVLLMLPKPADWRWMFDCIDTPWYPHMQLFRQPHPRDWDSVIENVVEKVQTIMETRGKKGNEKNPLAHLIDQLDGLCQQ